MFKKRALLVKFVLLVGLEVAADVSGRYDENAIVCPSLITSNPDVTRKF